jgi:hypothetical protein
VANGTSDPLFVDIVLKVFEIAIVFQLALVVGLFVIAIAFRSRNRRSHQASSRGVQFKLER